MHESIGAAIRRARRARGLTQTALAERAGLTQPAVSLLESGARVPPLPALERVADVLGLRVTITVEPADTPGGVSRAAG
ncbi:helix-turn-helix domain-containing protein [Actinomadura chibensis]|uniref:Helix-turn-helix transcriptional regulator n=1 Tax=Actinomadura chibensis TaxID=392828 RepID=A0A5D0NTC7_9ACTN|nr:helix-turn-helix transcriptional regulator [Actinomadura chibensis]TYB47950.1 helix-turn-helix transcriptional regulator [Actinomadura chibensis]